MDGYDVEFWTLIYSKFWKYRVSEKMLTFYYLCCRVWCPRVCWTLRCLSPKPSSSTASESWRPSTRARASFKTAVRQLKRIMGNVIIFMAFICIYNLQFIQLGQPSVNPPRLVLDWSGGDFNFAGSHAWKALQEQVWGDSRWPDPAVYYRYVR